MPGIDLRLDGAGCWPDLAGRPTIDLMGAAGPPIRLAMLPGGMTSGKPSVTIRIDLPDGTAVLTETSLAHLTNAVLMMQEASAAWRGS